jgi:tetratricopeptide (TPR) repeat protein
MGYWNYYLAWIAVSYLLAQPRLLVGLLVLLLLRGVLPAPGPIFRALRRGRALRAQVAVNPKNATAARDLAALELDLLRPGAALKALETGLARCPDDAGLLFLAGTALCRLGRHEEALPRLVAAVEHNPTLRFGLPYLLAGDALYALGRWEEALDAYERYGDINSSDLRGHLGRARAQHRLGDSAGAREALAELSRTFGQLPGYLRAQSWRPLLAAHWARIWMLRDPQAFALGLLLLGVTVALLVGLATWVPVVVRAM